MRFGRLAAGLAALAAMALTGPAGAHHSPVMFDQTRTLTLEGTVKQFQWTNPHCYIQLVVDGTEWNLEMGAPVYLYNRGWRPSTLKAGDRIRITAAPLRSGASGGLVLTATSLDGKTLGRVS